MFKQLKNSIYKHSTIYIICFALVLVNFISIGCQHKLSHQERVNKISKGMHLLHTSYKTSLGIVNDLHDARVISNSDYEKAKDIAIKATPIIFRLLDNWALVPRTDADIEAFVLSPDFQTALNLVLQLTLVAKENDLHLELSTLLSSNLRREQ